MVGPLELFYDLAVVVLVAQAAHRLAGHLTWAGLGQFAVVFTLVWIAWANGSLHHELHGHDDARARSTFLLQILVLAAMGAFIPQAGGARGAAFAVAAAVLFAVLAVLWLLAARGDRPEYRRPSRLFVAGTAACAVLLAGTALLPAGARVPAWGVLDVAYLAGFAAVLLTTDPAAGARADHHRGADRTVRGVHHHRARRNPHRCGHRAVQPAGQRAHPGRGAGRGRGRLRRLVDVLRLRRTTTTSDRTAGQRAVDTRSPAAHGRGRRDGRRDGQPRRPRP